MESIHPKNKTIVNGEVTINSGHKFFTSDENSNYILHINDRFKHKKKRSLSRSISPIIQDIEEGEIYSTISLDDSYDNICNVNKDLIDKTIDIPEESEEPTVEYSPVSLFSGEDDLVEIRRIRRKRLLEQLKEKKLHFPPKDINNLSGISDRKEQLSEKESNDKFDKKGYDKGMHINAESHPNLMNCLVLDSKYRDEKFALYEELQKNLTMEKKKLQNFIVQQRKMEDYKFENNKEITENLEIKDDDDIFSTKSPIYINKSSLNNEGIRVNLLECDDEEGYYISFIGEMINDKYKVISNSTGRGVFSNVVRCLDIINNEEVAIKIIRSNNMMKRIGEKEHSILTLFINSPNIVQTKASFIYRNHYCIILEWLNCSLRNYIESGCKININLLQLYAKQMFTGVNCIHEKNYIHGDLKPDNILIDKNTNILKISDFGSALEVIGNEPACYLVSRFYRAPEIILGYSYSQPIDIWSIGCTLYECFTGNTLFYGKTNNDMLRIIMEYKGKFPVKMLKQGIFTSRHFSNCYNQFKWINLSDGMLKIIQQFAPKQNIYNNLLKAYCESHPYKETNSLDFQNLKLKQLADLIEKCTILDPNKRIKAPQALNHLFFSN
ncbi:protein kinase domain-containing protein [Cryptosporidium andersoni]|uniref:Protein kinase domain-containing protein n=1 Tax=Cryptosporidium andersoni TaxID=117008 RepID=A0A1J4MTE8_9CRYT|nr:protein kinase domain-containing protein [Cryptosporidium andersoni]